MIMREAAYAEAISLLECEYVAVVEDLYVTRDGDPDLKLTQKLLRTVQAITILKNEMQPTLRAAT